MMMMMMQATASVDNETDTFIQRMIRENFLHCTVTSLLLLLILALTLLLTAAGADYRSSAAHHY
jgi:ABC-type multidrug transport system fused ATPase/permease subunit